MEKVPRTIADLREFYFGVYAPLYDYLNARLRRLPQELHFEAAAALDHLMRVGELADGTKLCEESYSVAKAAGHLKRATFDAFKLLHKTALRDTVKRLNRARYDDVDNGQFRPRVQELWYQAVSTVEKARALERIGDSDDPTQWSAAFEEWRKIKTILDELEAMERSEGARRARRKHARNVVLYVLGLVASMVTSGVVSVLVDRAFRAAGV